jgi:hypothetical protein
MSVSSATSRNNYTGNGATSVYSYSFRITSEDDLTVTVRLISTGAETTLTKTTDYTVSGVGVGSGGNVTLVDAGQAWLDGDGDLLATYEISIRRVMDLTQETDIRNQGDFYPEAHEDEFDKSRFIDQQQQDEIDRSLKLSESVDPSTFDPSIPSTIVGETNVTIMTDSDGDALVKGPTASEISNAQTYATNASNSATAAAASASAASTSETNAAASASAAQTAVDSVVWRDVSFKTFSDSPISITDSDRGVLFAIDTSGGNVVVTLPQISGLDLTDPWTFAVKKTTSDSNTITINRSGTDTINGGTSATVDTAGGGLILIPDTDPSPDEWTGQAFGNIEDGTVTTAKLNDAVFNDLTTVTAVDADYIPIADTGDSGNKKKALVSDLTWTPPTSIDSTDSPYTVLATDKLILVDGISDDITINLPAAASFSGRKLTVKRTDQQYTGNKDFADGDVTTGTDNINISSHGLSDLQKVQVSNAGGGLPTGLSASTDYWVIYVDADNFKLASSRANAVASSAVNITAASSGGVHTIEPQVMTCVLDGNGSETIDGETTRTMYTKNESYTIVSDGSNWIVEQHNTKTDQYSLGATRVTATTTNPTKGTVGTDTTTWYRDGQHMVFEATYNQTATGSGAVGSGDYLLELPAPCDTSYITVNTTVPMVTNQASRVIGCLDSLESFSGTSGTTSGGTAILYDATHFRVSTKAQNGASNTWGSTLNYMSFDRALVAYYVRVKFPVSGWEP